MKYSKDEALDEIMKRGKIIKKKHDKRNTVILSSATALSAFILVISVSIFGGGAAGTYSAYGSFVLNNDSIQYVVEALATFLFGSVVTIAIYKIRNSRYTKR
ncbi:MAG: hypothetical protein IKZ76_05035 [Lachnospiraceae bacterium]|nr:hypothetical protein [Lachnospiraceae bacterium]